MDIKEKTVSVIRAALEREVSEGLLPARIDGLSYDCLADELADLLTPLSAVGTSYEDMRTKATARLEAIVDRARASDLFDIAGWAVDAVRDTVRPVAEPERLEVLAALIPLLAPDGGEEAEVTCRFLAALAGRLGAAAGG